MVLKYNAKLSGGGIKMAEENGLKEKDGCRPSAPVDCSAFRAFVDKAGTFHCPCGRHHSRGPLNGYDVYRCLGCGKTFRVSGLVELR